MISNCDVLVLDWTTKLTRDRLVGTLIVNYLEIMGLKVKNAPFQNSFYNIEKHKPKVLLLLNTVGAKASVKIAKYAKDRNIFVVSLYGEGNFSEQKIEQFVFGHNLDKKEAIDTNRLVWSIRAKKLIDKYFPNLSHTTSISGSVGADNYVIATGKEVEIFKKYGFDRYNYKLVVGIGCWDFGLLSKKDHRHEIFIRNISSDEKQRIKNDGKLFNEVLLETVEKNPHVLFLIKEHPNRYDSIQEASAITGLELFENVLIVDKREVITECILSSDIWFSYESTTALEAWLAGKQTGLINPSGVNFASKWRAQVFEGQPNYPDSNSLCNAILNYQSKSLLPGWSELSSKREEILADTIGFSDGLNHVRVGNHIIDIIRENRYGFFKQNHSFKVEKYVKLLIWNLNEILKGFYLEKIRLLMPKRFVAHEWDETKLNVYKEYIREKQVKHYSTLDGSKKNLDEVRAIT